VKRKCANVFNITIYLIKKRKKLLHYTYNNIEVTKTVFQNVLHQQNNYY